MTIIIPSGYAQIVLNWKSANFFTGVAATTYGISLGEKSIIEWSFDIQDYVSDNLLPLMTEDITLDTVSVITETESLDQLCGLSGEREDDCAEPSIAILTRKPTLLRGPRARGRCYWPGMAYEATFNAQGLMSEASRGDYQIAFTEFYDVHETDMVILQGTEGESDPISPPPTFVGFQVDVRAATQRRRLRG